MLDQVKDFLGYSYNPQTGEFNAEKAKAEAEENMTPQDYIGHHLNNLQLDL
ncbi:hypothetical protein NVV43_32225, partial [Escherichia marmotae]|nr:hypothetical protein [Escherichia marmotae]